MKKILVIGIIALFFCMGIQPALSAISEDTNPPETTIQLTPETPDGENDWYVSPVTVSLVAIDNMSGVKDTYISINSEPWTIYETSFTLVEDGVYNIVYFSIDNAGNVELPKLALVKIDQTPPYVKIRIKCVYMGDIGGWKFVNNATAFDYMSGIEQVEFYLSGVHQDTITGLGPIYQWIYVYCGCYYDTEVIAYDYAGNSAYDEEGQPPINIRSILQLTNPLFLRFLDHFPLLHRLLDIWRCSLL